MVELKPDTRLTQGEALDPEEIYILGLGAVSPIGKGVAAFWEALFQAPASPNPMAIVGLPDSKSLRHAYALPGSGKPAASLEELAVSALQEALSDGLGEKACPDTVRLGLVVGTAAGDTQSAEASRLAGESPAYGDCHPYRLVDSLPDSLPIPLTGPVFSVSNACAAALYALSQAADILDDGLADAMLVVGVETLSRVTQAGFERMTALDPERCRPFDAERHGTVLGEGAAALLLASGRLCQTLGRLPYCRLAAFGTSCDAYHPTAPEPDGRDIRAAVGRALVAAGGHPEQVCLVVPHGTGTPLNDRIEGALLTQTFRPGIADLTLLPIKAHLGHSAGASGAFSTLVAAKALESGELPPTRHIATPDDALSLRFSQEPGVLPPRAGQRALVNAYGFGGNNLSLVLEGVSHG